jgi:hypothetical protein
VTRGELETALAQILTPYMRELAEGYEAGGAAEPTTRRRVAGAVVDDLLRRHPSLIGRGELEERGRELHYRLADLAHGQLDSANAREWRLAVARLAELVRDLARSQP